MDRDDLFEGTQERDDFEERLAEQHQARGYYPNLNPGVPVRESDEAPARGGSDRARANPEPRRRS